MLVDDNDIGFWLPDDAERLPPVWTAEFAGVRLVEAYRVHFRMPLERRGPASGGNGMPAYVHDVPVRRKVWNEKAKRFEMQWIPPDPDHAGYVDESEVPRDTIARPTSAEMEFMERVMAWPGRFLAHDADLASATAYWATWEARELDVEEQAERLYWAKSRAFQAKRREGLRVIAAALNAVGEGVV